MTVGGEVRHEIVPPNAGAMIESMRAFGYSPATAVADLVDNSITAGARVIDVCLHWSGPDSWVSVTDDGRGMTEDELRTAMRLGSRSPTEQRSEDDLGRFGLGLKTASFSQCRSLTVASRVDGGDLAVRRWDLDVVAEHGEWVLLKEARPGSVTRLEVPRDGQGTVVLWEHLDRLVGSAEVDDEAARERFLQVAHRIETHLGMVFHRLIGGRRGPELRINNNTVKPWDPFMAEHPSTQRFPTETLHFHGHRVEVSPFVLPHHSKLTEQERAAGNGPDGWNAHQGFYVYRGRRLLVAGDWLRLGPQKESHTRLARVKIDLPNELDAEWQIDVRKATARPPGPLRDRLRTIGEITRKRAIEVYSHRGQELARRHGGERTFVWRQLARRGKVIYAVNRDHPMIASALQDTPELEAVLRLTEETVPVPLIALKAAERAEAQAAPFEGADRELVALARSARDALVANGHDVKTATQALVSVEPFASHPEALTALKEN